MALFFGYDPGGHGNHGVAALRLEEDESFTGTKEQLSTERCPDVLAALKWFQSQEQSDEVASAIGLDTLLAWCRKGDRNCDSALRTRRQRVTTCFAKTLDRAYERTKLPCYSDKGGAVIHQNSLRSAMTINGIQLCTDLSLRYISKHKELCLSEAHPKLLVRMLRGSGSEGRVTEHYESLVQNPNTRTPNDHEADAFVAAWCASQWYYGKPGWMDLYSDLDDLFFPTISLTGCGTLNTSSILRDATKLAYPWPHVLCADGKRAGGR